MTADLRTTNARLDDVLISLYRTAKLIDDARKSVHAGNLSTELATVADAAEAFEDAVTALENRWLAERDAAARKWADDLPRVGAFA
jgi:hypothetical protein